MRPDRFTCTFPMPMILIYEDEFGKERTKDRFITCCSLILPVSGFARSMALDQKLCLLNYTQVVCYCSN